MPRVSPFFRDYGAAAGNQAHAAREADRRSAVEEHGTLNRVHIIHYAIQCRIIGAEPRPRLRIS